MLKMIAGTKKQNKNVAARQQTIASPQSQFNQKKIKMNELLERLSSLVGTGK
jgi:hypothetical protein